MTRSTSESSVFSRRFLLLIEEPERGLQEAGRFRTKVEAIEAFGSRDGSGRRGEVRSIVGPKSLTLLPLDRNEPSDRNDGRKRAPRKRKPGPMRAPRVEQAAVGAEIMVTAWGETRNLYDWTSDPRAKAGYQTIKGRLSGTKPWKPEKAISTPPLESALRAYNLARAPKYEAFGESKTINEWLTDPRCHTSPNALRKKLKQGIPTELALQKRTPSQWRKVGKEFEAFGESRTLAQWANDPRCRVSPLVLRRNLDEGDPLEEAMVRTRSRLIELFGERKTMKQWSEDPRCEVSRQTLYNRIKSGELRESMLRKDRDDAPDRERSESVKEGAVHFEALGESKSLINWLKDPRCQAASATILARIRAGVPFELAIGKAVSIRANYALAAFGETKSASRWAQDERCVVEPRVLFLRLRARMPLEQAMTMPIFTGANRFDKLLFVSRVTRLLARIVASTEAPEFEAALERMRHLVVNAHATVRPEERTDRSGTT